MIFVTVGSQKFQFNRLLIEIDKLIENKSIKEKVFAQIGVSEYIPKNYEYTDFTTQDEFSEKIDEANLIITHGGTGVIVNALKKGKKVIAIPRLSKYGEHVDDHQIQLIKEFEEMNFIEPVYEIDELSNAIQEIKEKKYNIYVSNTDKIIEDIEKFIGEEE
ncbi:MAG: PssE/Cps14G family polysaccharide biosynthesis glycosyltransferase [Clostridia bacterium]